jgi:hypothetical protein
MSLQMAPSRTIFAARIASVTRGKADFRPNHPILRKLPRGKIRQLHRQATGSRPVDILHEPALICSNPALIRQPPFT